VSSVEIASLLNDTANLSAATALKESILLTTNGSEKSPPIVPPFDFTGRYELYDSENFDEFLTELGLGYFKRLAATRASSEYFITKSAPDTWTLKTVSTFGESIVNFKDGVEFSEDRLDGITVRSIISVQGNKWVQKQFGDDIVEVAIVREFVPPGVKVTSVINGVVSIRRYKKID